MIKPIYAKSEFTRESLFLFIFFFSFFWTVSIQGNQVTRIFSAQRR